MTGRRPRGPARAQRLACCAAATGRPAVPAPQHIAFATDDVVAAAARACARPAPRCSRRPANYHDDLDARLDLDPGLLADLRELGLFYDEDGRGSYLHLFTEVLGSRVFFEVVQRVGGYDGYGTVNAPVRMAAHRRLRAQPPA